MASSVSSQCLENSPTLDSSIGNGSSDQLGGLRAYVTGSADSKRAVVLISDVFGYEAPNLRKLADKVAEKGFFVVVPDFLYGDYAKVGSPGFDFQEWRKHHSPDKGCEDARSVISDLRSKGVTSIGAVGFCWGGVVVTKLAKFDDIQAGVVLHPGVLTDDDINQVKVPLSILGAENDNVFPADQLKRIGEILSAKSEVNSFVKIFPGVSHGWSIRYSEDDESSVKSAEEAHSDILSWLTEYVQGNACLVSV